MDFIILLLIGLNLLVIAIIFSKIIFRTILNYIYEKI